MAEADTTTTDDGKQERTSAAEGSQTAGSEQDVDWKAEAEKARAESKKWEQRAKADFEPAKAWRDHEESQKSEDEKRNAREQELERRAAAAEARALRSDVADEKKIPVEWRNRLTGSTREELEADADQLLKLIGSQESGRRPDKTQGQQTTEGRGDWLRDLANSSQG